MRKPMRGILLALLPVIIGSGAYARTFFPPRLENSLPSEFSKFIERYLSELLDEQSTSGSVTRRLDFDDVRLTFPLTQSTTEWLMEANGIIFTRERDARYSVIWMDDSTEIGRMTFPASYNLIRGTSTIESFNNLLSRLSESEGHCVTSAPRLTSQPDSANIVRREGREFYLGHLTNHQWIDATNAYAVWSVDFPAESLGNLFCVDNMPNIEVALEMESYNLTRHEVSTNVATLRHILSDIERCDIYFGVTETTDDTGIISAMVVFHNPELAYLHKLDMTVDTATLFQPSASDTAPVKARLQPYIKLHNLTDLWGEKHNN